MPSNKPLRIDDYYRHRHRGIIIAYGTNRGRDINLEINEDKYHNWLRTSGRLDGTMDYYDGNEPDAHGQVSYTITPEEYWETATMKEVFEDLEMFILRHDLLGNSMEVFEALPTILKNHP